MKRAKGVRIVHVSAESETHPEGGLARVISGLTLGGRLLETG